MTYEIFYSGVVCRTYSDDDKIVDRAEKTWGDATRRYRQHLKRIAEKLPASLRRFANEYCLHDATVLFPTEHNEDFRSLLLYRPDLPRSGATIAVKSRDSLLVLWYSEISKRPALEKPVDSPAFHSEQVIWLYDEVNCLTDGQFSHEIMFSDGRVARLVFRDFWFVEYPDFSMSAEGKSDARSSIGSKAS